MHLHIIRPLFIAINNANKYQVMLANRAVIKNFTNVGKMGKGPI